MTERLAATDAEYMRNLADWFDAVRIQCTDIESGTHHPAKRLRRIADKHDGAMRSIAAAIQVVESGAYDAEIILKTLWPEAD